LQLTAHLSTSERRKAWPGWLTCSRRFTHTIGQPQDSESLPVKKRSIAEQQVTELTDNDGVFRLIRSFNAQKRSISECSCSLMAPLVMLSYVEIFNCVNFFNRN